MNLNQRKEQLIKENQEAIQEYKKAIKEAKMIKAKTFKYRFGRSDTK